MSSVTIFIQGHGSQEAYPIKRDAGLQLLSFCGFAGEFGRMGECPNGNPVDIEVVNRIMDFYRFDLEQAEMYPQIKSPLTKLYKDCGIEFRKDGFNYTYPKYERFFQLEPNDHENCRACIRDFKGRCLEKRTRTKLCPEYGITVVKSSEDEDFEYTLVSKTEQTRQQANLDITERCRTYWKAKAIRNAPALNREINRIFSKIYTDKSVLLTELLTIFRAMGFTNIYILDPTCRSSEENRGFKNAAIGLLENMKPKNQSGWDVTLQQASEMDRTGLVSQQSKTCSSGFFKQCFDGICECFKQKKIGGTRKAKKINNKNKKSKKRKSKKNKTRKIKQKN